MLVTSIAALAFASCAKNDQPQKEDQKEQEGKEEGKEEGNKEQEEEVKLAVDGKFAEWADIAAVEGQDALLLSKTQSDANKLYFYLEADLALLNNENVGYANYLSIYLDCNGDGAGTAPYWGGEEGSSYDVVYQIWLMTKGAASLSNWDTGFAGKGKIENGVYKAEISFPRSANELFKSKTIHYGMHLTDQYVDTSGGGEDWIVGELDSFSPVEGEDMAKMN